MDIFEIGFDWTITPERAAQFSDELHADPKVMRQSARNATVEARAEEAWSGKNNYSDQLYASSIFYLAMADAVEIYRGHSVLQYPHLMSAQA